MLVPTFDIFAGKPTSTDVLWKDAVTGLAAANDRMKELAAENPGPYFVYCVKSRQVLAAIDTSIQSKGKDGHCKRSA
jgi:hypothetical protein